MPVTHHLVRPLEKIQASVFGTNGGVVGVTLLGCIRALNIETGSLSFLGFGLGRGCIRVQWDDRIAGG